MGGYAMQLCQLIVQLETAQAEIERLKALMPEEAQATPDTSTPRPMRKAV